MDPKKSTIKERLGLKKNKNKNKKTRLYQESWYIGKFFINVNQGDTF